jgi:four helix bundle protein
MLVAVRDAHIRDAKLRDEALRAAKGMCLNCAEGAGRVTRADKARFRVTGAGRAFTIARGKAVEAAAAIEIAALLGGASQRDAGRVAVLADRVVAMLTGLIR